MSNANNNRISGIALTMLLRRPDLTSSVSEDNCFETAILQNSGKKTEATNIF